jgi:SAM-dependent methyltransferase
VPRNWDEHYAQAPEIDFTPVPLLIEAAELLPPGRALDLASGAGRNALYLAALGWSVVAVDASATAIRMLRERAAASRLNVETQVADLESGAFRIEPGAYDLICDFFYLQRDLFSQIREGIRPGGVVVAEIHLRDDQPHRFVLEPGELWAEFHGWKILSYSESPRPGHGRPSARLIARRA